MVIVVVGAMIYVFQTFGGTSTSKVATLEGIAEAEYFPEQINNEINSVGTTKKDTVNTYNAISFGSSSDLEITLVLPAKGSASATTRLGLFIDMSKGNLATNAGFLEKQLISDLSTLGAIDEHATTAAYKALDADGDITTKTTASSGSDIDGKFVIYFKDLQRGLIDNN